MNYIQNESGKTNIIVIVIVVLVVIAGGIFIFNTSSSNTSEQEDTMMAEDAMEESSSNDVMMEDEDSMEEDEDAIMEDGMTNATEIVVEGGMFYYDPDTIEAKVGEVVRVTFNSVDAPHDFDIDELDLDTEVIQKGESITFEFTPTEAGEFEYYCSVGNHRAQGMVGTLIVTE